MPQSPERDSRPAFIRTSKRGIIKPYESQPGRIARNRTTEFRRARPFGCGPPNIFSHKYLYIGFFHYICVVERQNERSKGRRVPFFYGYIQLNDSKMIDTKENYRSRRMPSRRHGPLRRGVHLHPRQREIELTIDSDTSVGIDACAELSRAIEADLDRDAEDFR